MKVTAPGFKHIRHVGGIDEYLLNKNGLRVLLLPKKSSSVVGVNVVYHVGSRNEIPGTTGSTHILEHMLFKGSKKFNKKNGKTFDNLISSTGAYWNATTWFDRTHYFEILPKEYLKTALDLEADRMRNAIITDKDLKTEMVVVRNEYERGENSPEEALDKNVWATAFLAHPYRHSTIGWKSDIEETSAEKLQKFYNSFYWPNNATLCLIGEFDTKEALNLILKSFGSIKKSPHQIHQNVLIEPLQEGERRTSVSRFGSQYTLSVAYKIPEGTNVDTPAIHMLSSVLSSGETSRLNRAFVDTAKATSVRVYPYTLKDQSLFVTLISLTDQCSPQEALKILEDEEKKVIDSPIGREEFEKIQSCYVADISRQRDGITGELFALTEALSIGDWTFYPNYMDLIKEVTPQKIQEVANKYFKKDQRTIGIFIPKRNV